VRRDPYEVLGVPRDAGEADVKKAFRRLARELHPDVNPDPKTQDRFKEINTAYEVLSDPQKKQVYDLGGDPGSGAAGGAGDGRGLQLNADAAVVPGRPARSLLRCLGRGWPRFGGLATTARIGNCEETMISAPSGAASVWSRERTSARASAGEAVEDAAVVGGAMGVAPFADPAVAQVVGADGAVAAAAEPCVDVRDADQRRLRGVGLGVRRGHHVNLTPRRRRLLPPSSAVTTGSPPAPEAYLLR